MADGKVTIDSELNDKGLSTGLKNIQGKLEGAGKKMQDIGGKLTKNLTLPIVAAGTGALLTAKKFDDSMRDVKATMGDSLGKTTEEAEKNFQALREEALRLGSTTAFSASQASEGMKAFAQVGWDTEQILNATEHALFMASASGEELGWTAEFMAATMNQFGIDAEDAQMATDVLTEATNSSGMDMQELAHAMQYAGLSAANAGMDLEQTSAILGIMADQGLVGSKAGTALTAMFDELQTSAEGTTVDFGEFTAEVYDAQGKMRPMTDILADIEEGTKGMSDQQRDAALEQVFGTQAMRGLSAVLGDGTDAVYDLEESLYDSEGAAKTASEEMEGGIGGSLRSLASAAESLAIRFGDVLAPTVQKVADFLADAALKFAELPEGTKKTIVAVAAVLAAIGPLLTILGTALIVIPAMASAFASFAGPILAVIGVITALIAIGVALYKNWDTVKAKATEVFSSFSPLLDTVKGAFQDLKSSVTPIMDNLKSLWQSLVPILEKLAIVVGSVLAVSFGVAISVFNAVVSAIGPLINAVISLMDFVVNMVNVVVALLTGDFSGAWEYLKDAGQSALDFFMNALDGVLNFLVTFVETIIDFFYGLYMTLVGNSIIPDMVEAIVEWFVNLWDWLVEIVSGIVESVVDFFTNIYETGVEIFTAFWEFIVDIWEYISETFENALDFILALVDGDFEGMKEAIENQMENAREFLSNIWEKIKGLIGEKASEILTNIIKRFIEIKDNIKEKITAAKDALVNRFTEMVTNAKNKAQEILKNVISKFIEIKNNITNKITEAKTALVNKFTEMVTSAKTKAQEIVNAAKEKFEAVKQGIKDKLTEAVTVVGEKIGEMPGKVMEFFGDMLDAGKMLVAGLINGIKQMGGDAIEAITGVVGGVIDKATSLLDFGSPSKLFHQFGEWTSEGLANGIEKMRGLAEKASESLAGGIETSFNPELSVGDLSGIPQLKGITPDAVLGNLGNSIPFSGSTTNNTDNKSLEINLEYHGNNPEDAMEMVDMIDRELENRASLQMYAKGVR